MLIYNIYIVKLCVLKVNYFELLFHHLISFSIIVNYDFSFTTLLDPKFHYQSKHTVLANILLKNVDKSNYLN